MSGISLLEDPTLAGPLVTLAAQSILISLPGVFLLKLLKRRPAPIRGLVCTTTTFALCLVFIFSIAFQISHVGWYKRSIASLEKRPAISLAKAKATPALTPSHFLSSLSPHSIPATLNTMQPVRSSQLPRLPVKAGVIINVLGFLWAGGFLILLLKLGYGLAFLQGFRFGLVPIVDDRLDLLLKTLAGVFGKSRSPELYASPKLDSPITIGLLNPVVILPEKLFGSLSENEFKSILLHELAHIYHYDHLVGLVKRIVLAAYWWNPLVYLINSEHDLAREEVSDNYVLKELNPKEYSLCLTALAEKVTLVSSLPATAAMAGRRFNLVKRVENILSSKRSLVMRTSLKHKLVAFAVCTALTLFIAGLHAQVVSEKINTLSIAQQSFTAAATDGVMLAMEGRNLSPERVSELEKKVAQNPDDLRSQTLLLGYYFSNKSNDKSLYKKSEQTILWLIQNHPEMSILNTSYGELDTVMQNYAEGEHLWETQLQLNPTNLKVISNAARYFIRGDLDLAISTFKLGKSLDPDNAASWDQDLGNAYNLKTNRNKGSDPALANNALNSFENAYAETASSMNQAQLLPSLAKAALKSGELDKAVDYANQMLTLNTPSFFKGDLIYNGNFVLGMIAIKKGDIDVAAKYLLLSADTPGSPVLNSFGPNMSLAKELLERGQSDVVLAFLKKCSKFWTSSVSPCSKWIQEMEEGQTPDFSMNLNY